MSNSTDLSPTHTKLMPSELERAVGGGGNGPGPGELVDAFSKGVEGTAKALNQSDAPSADTWAKLNPLYWPVKGAVTLVKDWAQRAKDRPEEFNRVLDSMPKTP